MWGWTGRGSGWRENCRHDGKGAAILMRRRVVSPAENATRQAL